MSLGQMLVRNALEMKYIEYSGLINKTESFNPNIPNSPEIIIFSPQIPRNQNVKIFSAIYGIISANEGIRPYRLDLNNSLKPHIENLTKEWKPYVNEKLALYKNETIIDLCSSEYSKLIDKKTLDNPYIQIDFKDKKKVRLTLYPIALRPNHNCIVLGFGQLNILLDYLLQGNLIIHLYDLYTLNSVCTKYLSQYQ